MKNKLNRVSSIDFASDETHGGYTITYILRPSDFCVCRSPDYRSEHKSVGFLTSEPHELF